MDIMFAKAICLGVVERKGDITDPKCHFTKVIQIIVMCPGQGAMNRTSVWSTYSLFFP